MTKYLGVWGKRRVWLVGFSFGADVLPTIVDKLSPENRARITQMVLLSPSRDVTFEIELEGYMIKQGWFKERLKDTLQRINPIRHYDRCRRCRRCRASRRWSATTAWTTPTTASATSRACRHGSPCTPRKAAITSTSGYQQLAQQMLQELPVEAGSAAAR